MLGYFHSCGEGCEGQEGREEDSELLHSKSDHFE